MKLIELLQVHDMQVLLTRLESLQASEIHDISLYTKDYIEELKEGCGNSSCLLLKKVFSFLPWYDHAVIRELVSSCDCHDGIQLLDNFALQIDPLQPIGNYSTPHAFSFSEIPNDHTMMAIRCNEKFSSLTLDDIYRIKFEMVQICDLTKYAFTLMGVVNSDSDVFYGFIPNAAVSLIISRVQQRSRDLYDVGVFEVATYPGVSVHTGSTYEALPRNHFIFIDNVSLKGINRMHEWLSS